MVLVAVSCPCHLVGCVNSKQGIDRTDHVLNRPVILGSSAVCKVRYPGSSWSATGTSAFMFPSSCCSCNVYVL